MEINSSYEKDGYDDSGDRIHNHAERRPPAGIRHESGALLPKILDAMTNKTDHDEPWRGGNCNGGEHDKRCRDGNLDRDDEWATICNREPNVNGRDYHDR
jgi:hypothetical protein